MHMCVCVIFDQFYDTNVHVFSSSARVRKIVPSESVGSSSGALSKLIIRTSIHVKVGSICLFWNIDNDWLVVWHMTG